MIKLLPVWFFTGLCFGSAITLHFFTIPLKEGIIEGTVHVINHGEYTCTKSDTQ